LAAAKNEFIGITLVHHKGTNVI